MVRYSVAAARYNLTLIFTAGLSRGDSVSSTWRQRSTTWPPAEICNFCIEHVRATNKLGVNKKSYVYFTKNKTQGMIAFRLSRVLTSHCKNGAKNDLKSISRDSVFHASQGQLVITAEKAFSVQ